jgi:hypothetical protein
VRKPDNLAGVLIGGVLGFWIAVGLLIALGVASRLLSAGFSGRSEAATVVVISGGAGILWGAVLGGIVAKTPHIALWRNALLGALYGAITSTMMRGGPIVTFGHQAAPWMLLFALLGAAVATIVAFMVRPRREKL